MLTKEAVLARQETEKWKGVSVLHLQFKPHRISSKVTTLALSCNGMNNLWEEDQRVFQNLKRQTESSSNSMSFLNLKNRCFLKKIVLLLSHRGWTTLKTKDLVYNLIGIKTFLLLKTLHFLQNNSSSNTLVPRAVPLKFWETSSQTSSRSLRPRESQSPRPLRQTQSPLAHTSRRPPSIPHATSSK